MILWLASYPRSGNTYIRVILNKVFGLKTRSIYGDTRDVGSDAGMKKVTGHVDLPENFDWAAARNSDELYVVKTHELFSNDYSGDKAILLIRDGRDASVSFLRHQHNFGDEITLEAIIDGQPLGFTWAEHEQSWRDAANNEEDVLFLKFEEFTQDPIPVIERIATFAKIEKRESEKSELPDFEALHEINPRFFRSGTSGTYADEMDVSLQRYFWVVNGNRMAANGYRKHLPQNANADRKMLMQYVSKHFKLAERNIQALMRENGFRIGAINQIFEALDDYSGKQAALAEALDKLNLQLNKAQAARESRDTALSKLIEDLDGRLEEAGGVLSAGIEELSRANDQRHDAMAKTIDGLDGRLAEASEANVREHEVLSKAVDQLNTRLDTEAAANTQRHDAWSEAVDMLNSRLEAASAARTTRQDALAEALDILSDRVEELSAENARRVDALSETLEELRQRITDLAKTVGQSVEDISELRRENGTRIDSIWALTERLTDLESRTLRGRWRRLMASFKRSSKPTD